MSNNIYDILKKLNSVEATAQTETTTVPQDKKVQLQENISSVLEGRKKLEEKWGKVSEGSDDLDDWYGFKGQKDQKKYDSKVHKGSYGTEYQGDSDEDDDTGTKKKKAAVPAGEKRGRGRPKGAKNRVLRQGEKRQAKTADTGEKRGRGRPPGSKNKAKTMEAIAEADSIILKGLRSLLEGSIQGGVWTDQPPKPGQKNVPAPVPMDPVMDKDGKIVKPADKRTAPAKPVPVKPTDKRSEVDVEQGVAETTGDKTFDNMISNIINSAGINRIPDHLWKKIGPINYKGMRLSAEVYGNDDPYTDNAYYIVNVGDKEYRIHDKPDYAFISPKDITDQELEAILYLFNKNNYGSLGEKDHYRKVTGPAHHYGGNAPDKMYEQGVAEGRRPDMTAWDRIPEKSDDDWGSMSKREFKRRELELELGNDERRSFDIQQDYNLVNTKTGKLLTKDGVPSVFSSERHARAVAAKLKFGNYAPVPVNKEGMAEDDMEEGRAFVYKVRKAKEDGVQPGETITVGGKTYPVKESKQIDECGDMGPMSNGQVEQPSRIDVSANMSSDGAKSVTVTAAGSAAQDLMQLLTLAGLDGNNRAQDLMQPVAADIDFMEEKDSRYEANTTPEEDVLPVQAQIKGGDGDVAGREKIMSKHGAARFSDNPLAAKESVEPALNSKLMREYNALKVTK